MAFNNVFSIELDYYKPLYYSSAPVYKRYDFINEFLKEELGDEYTPILALPKVRHKSATWLSETVNPDNAQTLSLLPPDQKEYILNKLEEVLEPINILMATLKADEGNESRKLGNLLEVAFRIPGSDHIIVDVQTMNFCLVAWGFDKESAKTNPKAATLKLTTDISKSALLSYDKDRIKRLQFYVEKQNTESKFIPPVNNEIEPDPLLEKLEGELDEKGIDTQSDIVPPVSENIHKQKNDENEPLENIKNETKEKPEAADTNVSPNLENNTKKEKKRKWFPWLLGSLLLLALLFILYLLLWDKDGENKPNQGDDPDVPTYVDEEPDDSQKDNKILPDVPDVLPPIDTTKIIIDKDDPLQQKIISNRLNVYLSKGTNIKAFGKEFKKKYPDAEYKIVYYTAASNRLMIECPKDKRSQFKKELKTVFKSVQFVMDETIFTQNTSSPFNDPGFGNQKQAWYFDAIQTYDAWNITKGSPDVIIAVIDNGFDSNHPELKNKITKPWNIPQNKSQVNTGLMGMRHGTHVAGIVGGQADNNSGISGIAPDCKILPVQVGNSLGLMTTSSIVDGLFYAMNNDVDVINMSLGSSFMFTLKKLSPTKQEQLSKTLYIEQAEFWNELYKLLYDNDIIVVQAAGNDNILSALDPMQRSEYTIKVNATNPSNKKAAFSNYGKNCRLSAPGTQIYNAVPRGKYQYLDGTSMASPIVAAACGLLRSQNPDITPKQCADLLYDTGLDVGPNIGRLIQLSKALGGVNDLPQENTPCEEEIDKLKEEIEKLKEQLGQEDTGMIIPDKPEENLSFINGIWKSSTNIINNRDKEEVELFFEFRRKDKGKLTIVEKDGNKCTAPLNVNLSSGKMKIDQSKNAICKDKMEYNPYTIICQSKNNNTAAECTAINKSDNSQQLQFKLIKVQGI